ncbi:MAG: hypothetical protein IJ881_04140 [Neisseriaceae bacterium]|nr:hypothetical protein [Neisseriaceae bacterium]MBR3425875.1 hypothetical protein [Neisseriaceae bacterium]
MSKFAIALPQQTIPEETQQAFLSLDYAEKRSLLDEVSRFFQNCIHNKYIHKQEQERCEILIKLGATNTMILEILPSIERQDIQNMRDFLNFDTQIGRIKQIKNNQDIEMVRQAWQELLQTHIGQKDEFECWLILADIFPEYTLGQLFNAVRYGEIS